MKIILSGNLRRFASFESEIVLEADNVKQALDRLVTRFPDLGPVIYHGEHELRQVHRVFLNGELLTADDMARELDGADELGILTAIAGG